VGLPKSVLDAADHISSLNLDYAKTDTAYTVESIGAVVWEWASQLRRRGVHGGVVLIDQLSHIAPSARADADWFEQRGYPAPPSPTAPETNRLEWQVFFLKLVAQKLGVTIVLAHQLNENHGDNEPGVSSIRGSRGIVHKANLVLIPWTPRKVANPFAGPGQAKMQDNDDGVSYMIGVKGREVATFREEVRWLGAQQRFVDESKVDDDYTPLPRQSARAIEGMNKLAELRRSLGLVAVGTSGVVAISPNSSESEEQA